MTINTGTGGFPIDGKLYNYDVDSASGDDTPVDWDPGDVKVKGEGADLSKGTKRTLASYLSNTTLGLTPSVPTTTPNVYPVTQDPNKDPTSFTFTTGDGHTAPFSDLGDQPQFKKQLDSTYTPAGVAIADKFVKGKQVPAAGATIDGNALLQTAAPEAGLGTPPPGSVNTTTLDISKPIKAYTDAVLQPNEYSNENTYTIEGQVKDLTQSEKKSFASYLGETTLGLTNSAPEPISNAYPVSHPDPNQDPTSLALTTEDGHTSPFTELFDQPQFQKKLDSTYTPAAASIIDKFVKGKQVPPVGAIGGLGVDGNNLLSTAAPPTGQGQPPPGEINTTQLPQNSPIKAYTDAVLQSNEYGNENTYTIEGQVKDLTEAEKQSLTSYLSNTTQGQTPSAPEPLPNAYPVLQVPNQDPSTLSLTTEDGHTSPFTDLGDQPQFQKKLDSTYTESTATIVDKFVRGRQVPASDAAIDGNTLLKDAALPAPADVPSPGNVKVTKLDPDKPVKAYTDDVLKSNEYGSENTYTIDGVVKDLTPDEKKSLASYLSKTTLGQTNSAPEFIPNFYPVEQDPNQGPAVLILTTEDGHTAPFSDLGDQPQFKKQLGSTYTPAAVNLTDDFVRGKQVPAANATINGNTLLQTAAPEVGKDLPPPGSVNTTELSTDSPVKAYTDAVLQPNTYGNENTYTAGNEVKDLPQEEKQSLASYLSRTTFGQTESASSQVSNPYPVFHLPDTDPTTLSLQTEKGYVPPFTELVDQPQFKKQLDSTYTPAAATLSNEFTKGRQEPVLDASTDGNYLLSTAAPQVGQGLPPPGAINTTQLSTDSPVKAYTDAVLGSNEYGSENPYTDTQVSVPLRPATAVGTTPRNELGAQDISEKDRSRLRGYITDKTLTGPDANRFPLDNVGSNAVDISESGKPNFPANFFKFVDGKVIDSSRSSIATQDRLGNFFRGRSKASPINEAAGEYDGNTLLRDATDEIKLLGPSGGPLNPSAVGGELPQIRTKELTADNPIKKYYGNPDPSQISNSVIYNRFNGTVPFETYTNGDGRSSTKLSRQQFALPRQYAMGKSMGPTDPNRSVTFGRLAQIGSALSIRAGSELGSFDAQNNPTNDGAVAAAFLPGLTQLGVERINRENLNASSVLESLTEDGIKEDVLIDPMTLSWGTLNNVQDQFSGVSNFGMQLLAVALVAALVVVFGALSVIVTLLGGSGSVDSNAVDKLGRKPYGASRADSSEGIDYSSIAGLISAVISRKFNIWQYLGMTPTLFPFEKTFIVGSQTFFGISNPGTTLPTMAGKVASEGVLSVVKSPGYYSVMARVVSRSFLTIGDSFRGLAKAFASGPTVAGVKQLFETIDVLRNSKFMRVLNIFAQLGDRKLLEDSKSEQNKLDTESIGPGKRFKSRLDLLPNGPFRSRLNVSDSPEGLGLSPKELGWATFRAADMFIMPENLASFMHSKTASELGKPSMFPTVPVNPKGADVGGLRTQVYDVVSSGRISTSTREAMERYLNSEYVPFYIHDVRTNEIVSFHAFLASLSDDYTASYDSVDGFGRVEPVKTYKGTTRKIGFSFYIIATSKDDFDSMWLKINKLTTLVYPQFSDGRAMINKERKDAFFAPFSQTIKAAPLVRVRIGDLIRSNYSKFNLARIFGYTYPGSKFDGVNSPTTSPDEKKKDIEGEAKRIARKFYTVGNTFLSSAPLHRVAPDKFKLGEIEPNKDIILPPGFVLKITKKFIDDLFECQVIESTPGDVPEFDDIPTVINLSRKLYKGEAGANFNIFEKYYIFRGSDLKPTAATQKKIDTEASAGSNSTIADYDKKALEFMSDDPAKGNAIVRSFRSSGGEGLAGFIESMNFNWMDKSTWETEGKTEGSPGYGRRAPKMCQVTISFSPIHDLTPGLDYVGGNRAPIYPVGPYAFPIMNKK